MIRNILVAAVIGGFLMFAISARDKEGNQIVAQAEEIRNAIAAPWKPLPEASPTIAFPAVGDDAAGLSAIEVVSDRVPTMPDPPAVPASPMPSASPEPEPTKTPPGEFKIVDASDLFIGTKKYLNKPILLRKMHCYYADVDDYRCVAGGSVFLAIFTSKVEPQAARDWIEKYCGQLRTAVLADKCLFNPKFMYAADDAEDDVVSGFQQRKVIRPPDGVTMIPSKKIGDRRAR